jgi:predicted phosphodiesterase
MARVGIIGDSHEPYSLEGYKEWCADVFDQWDVDTIVHIGDLVDHHSLSFHDSEPMLHNVHGEYESAIEKLQGWYDLFPELTLIQGNHDLIPARQLRKLGMEPQIFMKPLKEIYGMPEGWKIEDSIVIDDVLYHHGETAGGVNGFRMDAQKRMQCTVSGHNHSNLGVSYTASDRELVWGMAVGCGVDNTSMAFAYGKHFKNKPIIGCGVVIDGLPYVEAMDLGSKIRRI